ncbi:MAG: aminoacyl-tRNA hydrolase [Alphaproteobacteria bacterium]|nr:aminoacyl-tRNA hydrolase [Alphaproteobacteria bacterium]HPF47741.1 aminoacyl-tRNA hydrolase [Emcibacteraceae bacterium]HRW29932.1 aminoacyl-tRNA hydrolase [Emcibacteraceae bacterium]
MLLIVGLGNPGIKYENNRHNIGFMAVDEIILRHNFSEPKMKFQGALYEGTLGGEKAFILKPLTFMNQSGKSVGEIASFYKIQPEDIFVFYDELDIAPGKIKFKTGGGNAGHNGLRSIDQFINKNYHRIRLGIGHPGDKSMVTGHVLGDFSKNDEKWLDPLLDAVGRAADKLTSRDGIDFLNEIGLILKPNENNSKKKNTDNNGKENK